MIIFSYLLFIIGTLVLFFNELVSPASFMSSFLTIQSDTSAATPLTYTLTEGLIPTTMADNETLTILLSTDDVNALKVNRGLATSENDTFLGVLFGAVTDVFLNSLEPISSEDPLAVQVYIADTTQPDIDAIELDLDRGLLILNVTEPIIADSFNLSQITLTNSNSAPTVSYVLTGGELQIDGTALTVVLTDEDVSFLKRNNSLATSAADTYLVASPRTFEDTTGTNLFVGIPADMARQASFIADTSPPSLVAFNYEAPGNRAGVILVLRFSETIEAASLNVSAITLQDGPNSASTTQQFTLTSGQFNDRDTSVLAINVTDEDYQSILALPPLGTSINATFLSVSAGAVQDLASFPLVEITSEQALQVDVFSVDLEPPEVVEFTFDLDAGQIIITFTEPVQPGTFNASQFTIQASSNETAGEVYTLSSATAFRDGNRLIVLLAGLDLDELNRNTELATSENTTYLSITTFAIEDTSNNPVVAVPNSAALQATEFVEDSSGPTLLFFEVNLDLVSLTLSFSETVNISTLNVAVLTLQNAQANATESFTLTGGEFPAIDTSLVNINFTTEDYRTLQSLTELGINTQNTFISFPSSLVEDLYSFAIQAIGSDNALQAAAVGIDTVQPVLTGFDFDMDAGTITLSFSEVVETDSFLAAELNLQNSISNANANIRLTENSLVLTPNTDVVTILIDDQNLDAIKVAEICLEATSCYITYSEQLVTDTFNLSLVSRLANNGLPVSNHTRDTTPPQLLGFASFNLNAAVFTLEFSEAVNTSSLDYSGITLQSFSGNPNDLVMLTSGSTSGNARNITLALSTEDTISLKRMTFLCGTIGTCYLRVASIAIADLSNNQVVAIPDGQALLVEDFSGDDIAPVLQEFDLDINAGVLTLFFNEIVDTQTFNPSSIVIQSNDSATADMYRLTDGLITSATFSNTITLQLTMMDLNNIKVSTFAKERADTYLTIEPSAVADLAPTANAVEGRTLEVGDGYTPDSVAPQLLSYHLNLNTNDLVLTFNEPVSVSDINLDRITVSTSASGVDSHSLTGGTLTSMSQQTIVNIALSSPDLIVLKYGTTFFADSSNSPFLSIAASTIADTSGLNLPAISSLPATPPNMFTRDSSPFQLEAFTLDIFNGLLVLTFNDVANASTFTADQIILQSQRDGGTSTRIVGSTTTSPDGLVIEVVLAPASVAVLTTIPGFATSVQNTFIVIQVQPLMPTIRDFNGDAVLAIPTTNALVASEFIGGGVGTELASFTLDMNTGVLAMQFNNPVDVTRFNASFFSIQDASGAVSVPLTGGTAEIVPLSFDRATTVTLTEDDLNALKAEEGVALSTSNTYLVLNAGGFVDLTGGDVTTSEPVRAAAVVPDTIEPQLSSYALDLNNGQLLLTFSETVLASSISASQATLHNAMMLSSSVSFLQLSTGSTPFGNAMVITFQLNNDDLNALKSVNLFATFVSDTFLTYTSLFATDAFGNRVVAQDGLMASQVDPDNSSPMLEQFTLDLDEGTVVLSFSEVIRVGSILLDQFTLQASDTSAAVSQSLANSVVSTTTDSDIVTVRIQPSDLFPLQQSEVLAIDIDSTFISVGPNAGRDRAASANSLSEIQQTNALQASMFIPDLTSPLLVSFSLALSDGTLLLTFNEVVNVSTINLDLFYFQDSAFSPAESSVLSQDSSIISSNAAIVEVSLNRTDFDGIQANENLGTVINNSFLNLTYNAVSDVSGNPNTASLEASQANNIFADNSAPMLEAFEINMNLGVLILSYSEAINAATFVIGGVRLHSSSAVSPSVALTPASRIISPSSSTIIVDFNGDINPIREAMTFGSDLTNTFVSIAGATAFDFAGNAAPEMLTPMNPFPFFADNLGPILSSFELDLNTGQLVLNFAETVVETSFNATQIMFQNSRSDAIEFVSVTASISTQRVSLSTIVITLTPQDIDELNIRPELATGLQDTFLSLMPTTVQDVLGNLAPTISIDDAIQISVYVRDGIRPTVESFQIDLNNYTITFTFDEVPNPDSVNMTFLAVRNDASVPTLNFTFTGRESSRVIGRAVIIELTQEDVDTLNALDVCTSELDCFAVVQSEFITDAAGNQVMPTTLAADAFTTDITRPELVQFVLMDIDSGIMLLQFSETIDVDTVQLDTLRLQSNADGGGVDFSMLTLSGGNIIGGSGSQLEIMILLGDLNNIKRDTFLCTRQTDCYIRFPAGLGSDAFANPLLAVGNTIMPNSQHYPQMLVRDNTGPVVLAFNLDIETGFIDLSFNELFLQPSFDPTEITLQDAEIATTSYTLTGGTVTAANDTGITVQLLEIDRLRIKGNPTLARGSSSTYLVNTPGLVDDFFNIPAVVRENGVNALLVSNFVDDITIPTFVRFAQFSREAVQLNIEFSEPIDVTAVNYSRITLQSAQDGSGSALTLMPGFAELNTINPRVLEITLSLADQFTIKQTFPAAGIMLAVSRGTSFVAFESGAFADTAGNLVEAIATTSAERADSFIPDLTAPRLAGFEINMETGQLLLTYDDVIIPTVYNPTGITIQNAESSPTELYELSGGSTFSTESLGFVINATITSADLLQLKFVIGLATSLADTFIAADNTVTVSANGDSVFPTLTSAIQGTNFIRDQTPPTVSAFSLNLTSEILSLVVDEPLDPAAFNPAGVTLQNSPNNTGMNSMSVVLTGGLARQTNSIFELEVQLSNTDLNSVKQMLELATSIDNIYISLDSTSFADFGGNGVNPVSGMQALNATEFGGDLIPPFVSRFTLDLNVGQITISFSEVVDIANFDPSSIALQSSINTSDPADSFTFSTLSFVSAVDVLNNLSSSITYQLTEGDLNAIKIDSLLGVAGTTFATFDGGITTDSSGRPLIGAPNDSAIELAIVGDTSPPIIERLVLDLDRGVFTFTFDEPVLNTSVDVGAVSLVFLPNSFYSLSVATIAQTSDLSIEVRLSLSDLLDLLEFEFGRVCDVVFFTPEFISDLFGNRIAAITLDQAIVPDVFIPDNTSPSLVAFDLDMNEGLLNLTFSEAILLNSFNSSGITIQNAPAALYSYTLTSESTAVATGPRSLLVTLTEEDLSGIKAAENTGTSIANTFIAVTNVTIMDPFNNTVAETPDGSAVAVSGFIGDSVRPELVSFFFGPVDGRVSISLTFTEVIDASSVLVDQILLSSEASASPTVTYTLLSSSVTQVNSEVINIPLSDDNMLADLFFILESLAPLGQRANATFVSFPSLAAADSQGNRVVEVPLSNASQSTAEPGDLQPPELRAYTLNLNTATMILEFSEEVSVDSFDFTALTFQSSASGGESYTLTGGNAIQINGSVYLVMLSNADVNNLEARTNLATSFGSTFLSLDRGLARDFSGLDVLPIEPTNARSPFNYTEDAQSPELIGFEVILSGADRLILSFSETVLFSTVSISRFTLLSGPDSTTRFTFDASSPRLTTMNGAVIEYQILITDKAALQLLPGIATTVDNTYISVGTQAAVDSNMNSVLAIPASQPLQASNVVPDILPPSIAQFDIDMDGGILTLYADEPLNENSVNVSAFTLQNAAVNPSAAYRLITGDLTLITDFTVLTISINEPLNVIKELDICTNVSVCFLTYDDGAVLDTFGEEAVNITVGISVNDFTGDTTPPVLTSFAEFNRALGTLNLTFSETIRTASFNPTGITLQSLTSDTTDISTFTLTGGITTTMGNARAINVDLSDEDMAAIRLNPFLCTSRGSCYVTLTAATITDIAGNMLMPETSGLLASQFVFDDIPPALTNFSLNVDDGTLVLTFSEPVSAEVFRVTGIALQAEANSTSSYRLLTSSTSSLDGVEVVINLSSSDLNQIKSLDFATDAGNTYLTIDPTATRDLALQPNRVMAIDSTNALPTDIFIPDTTAPVIESFSLNLNGDIIEVVINEPINESSIDFTDFTIGSSSFSQLRVLSGANITSTEIGRRVTLTLSLLPEDIIAIKSNTALATDVSNAYLRVLAGAFQDVADNMLSTSFTQQAVSVTVDTTPPKLASFTLDLQTDRLSLTFDDVVDPANSFDPTGITIQSGITRVSTAFYTLTTISTTTSQFGYEVVLDLNTDAQAIRENTNFGTQVANTFITLLASTIDTPDGEDNSPITDGRALQASRVIFDSDPPILSSFALDLDDGELIITFSDFIDTSSLDLTRIMLQNGVLATPGFVFRLTGGSTILTATELAVTLSPEDLNGIKAVVGLATSLTTTYIIATAATVQDLSGNSLIPIVNGMALQVSRFTPDTTRPILTSFILDRNSGIVSLQFTEVVNVPGFDAAQITLQNRANINTGITQSLILAGSDFVSTDISDSVGLRLPIEMLQTLMGFSGSFGDNRINTFLSLSINTVTDLNNNPVNQISRTAALMATEVIPDMFPPVLEAFDLNLGTSVLTLVWSKPVLVSSLVVTGITLENPAPLGGSIPLTAESTTQSLNGSVIDINLGIITSTDLKQRTDIATSRDDTYISIAAGIVRDALQNRPSDEILSSAAQQVRVFTADLVPPMVISYVLNLDMGTLVLTFDEQVATFDENAIQIQNDLSFPTSSYVLQSSSVISMMDNVVAIQLSDADQDGIKGNPNIAVNVSNTFIALLNGSASDSSGNVVTETITTPATGTILQDITPPELLSYTIDLSTEFLALTFTEVIDTRTIYLPGLTIQSQRSPMPLSSYTLTESSIILAPRGRILEIHLIGTDASAIKATNGLATTETDTFIALNSSFASDYGGNAILEIPPSVALMASSVSTDISRPTLSRFGVDLATSVLSLTFSEAINISTLNTQLITLHSTANGSGLTLPLQGGSFPFENAAIINVSFTAADINFLKTQSQLGLFGSSISNTFLSLTEDAAEDTSGNRVRPIPATMPRPASFVNPDNRGPVVVAFTLDVNNGNLTLHFDEIVDIATVNISVITLRGANSNTSEMHTVTTAVPPVLFNSGTNVMITLSDDDLNAIKGAEFCNTTDDCYITHLAGLVQDELGNQASSRVVPNALQASQLGMDFNSPALVSYVQMDLDSGILRLQFSETLYGASVQFTSLYIQSSIQAGVPSMSQYFLTGGQVIDSSTPILEIQLTDIDINNIKRDTNLCIGGFDCAVQFTSSFATDFAGNAVEEFTTPEFLRSVPANFQGDNTGAFAFRFEVDLDNSQLIVTFNEPVLLVRTNEFTIQDAFNATIRYTLQTRESLDTADTVVTIALNQIDVNQLKTTAGLAKNTSNTYLTHTQNAVLDFTFPSNLAQARVDGINPLQAAIVIEDTTPPQLVAFEVLNFNTLTLQLQFDEPVDPASFSPELVTLYSSLGGTGSYTLTGGNVMYSASDTLLTTLSIALADLDVLNLQGDSSIATSEANTYIAVVSGAFSDFSDNSIAASSRLQAQVVIADTSPASVVGFTLDMNSSTLILTFDDVVIASTFDPTAVTLLGDAVGSNSTVTISGGVTPSSDGSIIELPLIFRDIERLRLLPGLATSMENTFLSVTSGVVQDFQTLGIIPIDTPALQVTEFIPDRIPPVLNNFTLSIENGTLELYFSEIMEPDTYTPMYFTLQSASNSSDMPLNTYTLTSGEATRAVPNTVILLTLSESDLNGIKMQVLLGTDEMNTYLSLADGAIRDTGNNSVVPIPASNALEVSLLTPDVVAPELVRIVLDLDEGGLFLEFTEALVATGFESRVTLIAEADPVLPTTFRVIPSSPTVIAETGSSTIEIQLSDNDLSILKMSNRTVSPQTTFVSIDVTGVTDFAGFLLTINGENVTTLPADVVILDTSGPRIVSGAFDLNTGALSFLFDEFAVRDSLNISAVSVVDSQTGELILQLDSATTMLITTSDGRSMEFTVPFADLNIINSAGTSEIALSIASGFIEDILQNSFSQTVFTPVITEDQTPPTLNEWTIDMNSGLLELTFSEAVRADDFNISLLTLGNAPTPTVTFQPATGNFSILGSVLSVQLSQQDLDSVKELGTIGLSPSTTYLRLEAASLADLRGNAILAVPSTPVQTIVPDTVPPELSSFSFEFTNNGRAPAALVLYFSEPVNASSIDLPRLVLQNATGSSYTLTTSTVPAVFSSVVAIGLSNGDLEGIATIPGIGTDEASTLLSVSMGALTDVSGVSIEMTPALAVTPPLIDLDPPRLLSFTFNLDNGNLTFVFSQEVLASTFDGTALTMQSTEISLAMSYTFVGGDAIQITPETVYVPANQEDLFGIRAVPGLAESLNTTFISLMEGLIQDVSGHLSFAIASTNALRALEYTPEEDEIPRLLSFSVDLTPGELIILTFSEPVLADSLQLEQFLLQNDRTSPTRFFNFSSAATITQNSAVIEIDLSFAVRDSIISATDIATTPANSFISVMAGAAMDRNTNALEAIPMSDALQATSVVSGILPPTVRVFDLDLNAGVLEITFDKSVVAEFFNLSTFVLQNNETTPTASYSLISSFVNPVGTISSITVSLTLEDLNNIKRLDICDAPADCYLSHSARAFQDVFTTRAENDSIQVSTFVADSVEPMVLVFSSINIESGQLVLSFDEPINASTFSPSGFTLQSLFSIADSLSRYTLTGGSAVASENSVIIQLSATDLSTVQIDPELCTWRGNCYIALAQSAIEDPAGNGNAEAREEPSLLVREFIHDTEPPTVTGFMLDLNDNVLVLSFSESVNPSTFDASGITFLNAPNGSESYTLTDSSTLSEPGTSIVITLSAMDSNALKNSSFATSPSNTFISIDSRTIEDLAFVPNPVAEVNTTSPLSGAFTEDTSSPEFIGFDLNIDTDTLTLTFNEPIDLSSVRFTDISIAAAMSGLPAVRLSGGTILSDEIGNVHTVIVALEAPDIIALKTSPAIASSSASTFVVIPSNALTDVNGVSVSAVTRPVDVFTPDLSNPRLVRFALDMVEGILYLTFDDIVVASTFNPQGIVLQSNVTRTDSNYRLTEASHTNSADGYEIVVNLTITDLYGVKAAGNIGNSIEETFITIQGDTIDDPFDVDNIPITDGKALMASNVIFDVTRPTLSEFNLDVNSGFISLTFDDVIDPGTFNISGITFQTAQNISQGA